MIELAVLDLGRGPGFPTVGFIEDESIFLPVQRGLIGTILFKAIEVFQEKKPGRLLRVIEFSRASRLFPEDIVDIFKSLFEHGCLLLYSNHRPIYRHVSFRGFRYNSLIIYCR